jgi:hypothetical protein
MARIQEKSEGYNGWRNYETWNLALWLGEGSYNYWREVTQEAWDETDEDETPKERSDAARIALARRLESETEESLPDLGASCWADLLGAAVSEIDYFEIADNWLSEIDGYKRS